MRPTPTDYSLDMARFLGLLLMTVAKHSKLAYGTGVAGLLPQDQIRLAPRFKRSVNGDA
jgi:hypothetical protein